MKQWAISSQVISMNEFVKCPYCGSNQKRLWNHIKIHNKTMKDLKSEYPNAKTFADSEKDKFRQANKIMLSNPDNLTKITEAGKRNLTNFNKTQWTSEKLKQRSQIMKNLWKTEDYRKHWHDSRMQPEHLTKVAMNKWKKKSYENGEFRSSYESQCANVLTKLGYDYKYEPFYVPYTFENKNYAYCVDFYIKSLNLVIEVKPFKFIGKPKNLAKACGTLESGYNFIFLTEKELWKDLEFINNILIKGSTTIERITNKEIY